MSTPKQNTPKNEVVISDATYKWLMDITVPNSTNCNSSLGEFVEAETRRNIRNRITLMKEKRQ